MRPEWTSEEYQAFALGLIRVSAKGGRHSLTTLLHLRCASIEDPDRREERRKIANALQVLRKRGVIRCWNGKHWEPR